MNIRSISFVVAVLAMSTVAGFAQAWTKNFQDWSQVQTQNPQAQVQNSQTRVQNPPVQVQSSQVQTQSPQVRTQSPQAQVQSPPVQVQSPQVQTQSSQVRTQSPQAQVQNPPVQVQSSQVQAQSPQVRTQSPQAQVQSPPVQSPPVQVQNPQAQVQYSHVQKPSPQDWTQNLYANVDLGGVYQQENTTLFQSAPFPTSGTATFNLGVRGNVALGYNINKLWAVEFQTGVLWNSMDTVNGVSLDQPYPFNTTFDTYTVPLLVNIIFKIPPKGPLVPYIGIGMGGTASILSYSQATTSVEDYNLEFAYQAEAGLKYRISKKASIGVAYQFLGTTDPSWHAVLSIAGNPPLDYQFKEKGFYTHSLVVNFTWNF